MKREKEAVEIISLLVSYGDIHPVEGASYPGGTHKEVIQRARRWLNRYYERKRTLEMESRITI